MTAIRYLLISALVFMPSSPFATTFHITRTRDTNDGACNLHCSLREAIEAANANPGADDIPVPTGQYLLSLGQLVISDDLQLIGEGENATIINAGFPMRERVFTIDAGVVVAISDVTIRGGNLDGGSGGGILNDGDLTVTNSTISHNVVWGGSYDNEGAGGGISSNGVLTLINSSVLNNEVAEYGGGISASGTITLIESTVSFNDAHRGGGGIRNLGDMAITNSTVSGNYGRPYASGGGILNYGGLRLTNSTVSFNVVGYGEVGGVGGGISNTAVGSVSLVNSTVAQNRARYGGGISGSGSVEPGRIILSGTIVADNDVDNCSGSVASLGYNLTDDTTCGLTGLGDLIVADAMLGPLQDNGGPTKTHALLAGSPAIDAGCPNCPPPDTDQRGVLRPQGAGCDIGAVEYLPEPRGSLVVIVGAALLARLYRRRQYFVNR